MVPAQSSGTVLLLDHHDRSRAVHEELLESLGWTTTMCPDATTMLRSIEQSTADTAVKPAVAVVVVRVRPTEATWEEVEQVAQAAASHGYPLVLLLPADQQDNANRIAKRHVARCLTKPVKPAELHATLSDVRGANRAGPSNPTCEEPAPVHGPQTVLLAEDCLVNQEVAVGLLELQGHTVFVVNNGREAVDATRQRAFDLVLMDVEMPELDGLEATRLIRNMERDTGRHTLIVAMTAHAVTGFRQKCLTAGMDDYISKPIDPHKLYQIMESLWRERCTPSAVL